MYDRSAVPHLALSGICIHQSTARPVGADGDPVRMPAWPFTSLLNPQLQAFSPSVIRMFSMVHSRLSFGVECWEGGSAEQVSPLAPMLEMLSIALHAKPAQDAERRSPV